MQILAELSDFEVLLLYIQSKLCCPLCSQYNGYFTVRCIYCDIRRCVSVTQNIKVSVFEGLMCDTLYGHAFQTYRVRPNHRDGRFSGAQHKDYDFTMLCGCD